jgi:hypothetical protein
LKKANETAKEAHYREEITSYFKDNPNEFKTAAVHAHDRFKLPTLNLSFDDKEDLKLIRALYHKFYQEDIIVPLVKVISFLKQHPEIADLNAEIVKKAIEEREQAARAKAEAEAAAAAERAAAREREVAERHAAKPKSENVKPELGDIIAKRDIFKLEPEPEEEKKEVTWSDLFGEEKEEKEKEPEIFSAEESEDEETGKETESTGEEPEELDESGKEEKQDEDADNKDEN